MVVGGGFEPPKLARQIYSLIPLATREPHHRERTLYSSQLFPAQRTQGSRCNRKQPKTVTWKPLSARVSSQNSKYPYLKDNLELARGVEPPTG